MVSLNVGPFARRLRGLMYKNFLVAIVRRPVGFFLFIYGIPIAVLAILLSIPDFVSSSSKYGSASPEPIKALGDVVDKKLVIVQPPHLGPDVQRVVDTFTEGIDPALIHFEQDDGSLPNVCMSDLRGVSPCFASVTFLDSPQTTKDTPIKYLLSGDESKDKTWSYAVRLDPSRSFGRFDANTHDNKAEKYQLPLQLAINKAITNTTASTPEAFGYTQTTQEDKDREDQRSAVNLVGGIIVFALFVSYLFIIYRHTTLITAERESGMAQLIDSMGGGSSTAAARVLAWVLVLDLSTLPVCVVFGVLFSQLLFPSSGVGVLVGWQILLGLAVNSSTVFAAAFFRKSRVSSVYVIGAFLLLAVGAQVHALDWDNKPGPAGPYVMALLFPSSNFVFFVIQSCIWELLDKSPDLGVQPVLPGFNERPQVVSYKITQGEMLGFLVLQIVAYPLLAILVEKLMHGIDFRSRTFQGQQQQQQQGDKQSNDAVAETFNLRKEFTPSILEKIFCCGRRRGVTAVDGVSFQGHKGQILCLVGPNGSGKTTTLHMMSGFTKPTSGTVQLDASPSQIGICPQHNTFWDDLTVAEHMYVWNQIKAAHETAQDQEQLIAACDLGAKERSKAGTLSGGQKRKLQLACMFIGGSTICLIDECTSGLDPLSRRVIWEILLEQRARRSIIFTTHFLDEVDVLADHIVILTRGSINCQGAAAELKNIHGGGYRVLVPRGAAGVVDVQYPSETHQDRLVYTTPDSQSAAKLSSAFSAAGVSDVGIAGPQVEDVFLRVADEGLLEQPAKRISSPVITSAEDFELEPARVLSFGAQLWVLFRKRVTVLKRFWFPYLWVVVLPIVITSQLNELVKEYYPGNCEDLTPEVYLPYASTITWNGEFCDFSDISAGYYGCERLVLGPPSANRTLHDLVMEPFSDMESIDNRTYYQFVDVQDSRQQVLDRTTQIRGQAAGAIFMGDKGEAPVIGFNIISGGYADAALQMLNMWTEMETGIEINAAFGEFSDSSGDIAIDATLYAAFFTLVHAIWPAAMVLYPAIEKARRVRALEYANGVRRAPLWIAYGLFDSIFVVVIAIGCSLIVQFQLWYWNGPGLIMLPILILYGVAAVLLGYVVSHFVTGPLKSFMAMGGISLLMYAVAAISFSLGSGWSGPESLDAVTNGLTFGLNLVLPIGNVFRAVLLGGNVRQIGCRNGVLEPAGSIYAYGGPILYLAIQVIVLLLIIVWIEGDVALFRRKGAKASASAAAATGKDSEKSPTGMSPEVKAEKQRVEQTEDDFLRLLNVDKSFGSTHAVQNVTLGVPAGHVMALLGPNGAGKSTLVNMIQSELRPDHGRILLRGEDSRTRSAQRFLGVCPQFDALDLMTTREHLEFYARVKGIRAVSANVEHVMARLDLTPHARTNASKLSGGNKRKLSLAIALMGAPPVMVLDEPTSAMDAVAKRSFWRLVRDVAPGRSVLLTTHSMEEADALATRAAIIAGRLLAVGTTGALRERYSNVYYVSLLLASAPGSSDGEMAGVRAWVQDKIPGAELERAMLGGQVRFTIPGVGGSSGRGGSSATAQQGGGGRSAVAEVIDLLEREKDGLGIAYYSVGGATLESVFLSVARENNAQEEDGVARRGLFRRMLKR